jgi:probable H4MPT-linked C1 transfer pathway protein
MTWLALDIGGANIKAADGLEYAVNTPFALWRNPGGLQEALRRVIEGAPACDRLAVTMTGELCDCFQNKREGVHHILDALDTAADGRQVWVYQVNGQLAPARDTRKAPLLAAASNWHVLARYVTRFADDGTALLVDIGSTTTDVIPLTAGRPMNRGNSDTERLICGELIYTGVERSPICAIVGYLPYRGQWCAVAQEYFATTLDAYLTLNELPEEPDNQNTADGRAATRAGAKDRLARSICADPSSFDDRDALCVAETVCRHQIAKVAAGIGRVLGRLGNRAICCVISGRGEFLARRVLDRLKIGVKVVALSDELGAAVSRCAPAHALAVLAKEGAGP